jgi:tRNA A37 threonylcarbamoyladenosine synthetase subunit TsaC/SUA5/YrdC
MSHQVFHIHPEHPQLRLIRQAAQIVRDGGLIALPTDAAYSLAGHINDADLINRLKAATPGPYTFVLEGTRELPRRVLHHKRKTIGLRMPDHPVVQALLEELNEPMLCSTFIPAGEEYPLADAEEIVERFGRQLELVIDSGACGLEVTTAVDLTGDEPVVLREGKGALEVLGL